MRLKRLKIRFCRKQKTETSTTNLKREQINTRKHINDIKLIHVKYQYFINDFTTQLIENY